VIEAMNEKGALMSTFNLNFCLLHLRFVITALKLERIYVHPQAETSLKIGVKMWSFFQRDGPGYRSCLILVKTIYPVKMSFFVSWGFIDQI
jgi:hypothetical protein